MNGYLVMRTEGSSEPKMIADLDKEINTFVDEGVTAGTYVYSVRAYTSESVSGSAVVVSTKTKQGFTPMGFPT